MKNKWVFVWMGEAAQADSALLPGNFSCDSPEWDYGDRPGARRHRGGARGIRVTRKVHDVPPPPYYRSAQRRKQRSPRSVQPREAPCAILWSSCVASISVATERSRGERDRPEIS